MAATQETVHAPIGKRTPRVDGPLKVSGQASYTSDFHFPGLLYAMPVCATIANGRLEKLDIAAAEKMPGIVAIYHHGNIGKIFRSVPGPGNYAMADERRPAFEDDVIRYWGQYVAVVIGESFETAQAAAHAVKATYREDKPDVDPHLSAAKKPEVESERGDCDKVFDAAAVQLDHTYVTPIETHNPIELHSTIAVWDGPNVTLYTSTQAVVNHREVICQSLGVPKENVRVISKFLGSGFGGKLWPWPHCAMTAAAARHLKRPVKIVLERKMMFECVGHRPITQQRVRLSATPDGTLTSLQQDFINSTSILDDYKENCGEATTYLYGTPNLRVTSAKARRNLGAPTSMRGPGAVPGLFATESAFDELAIKLKIDPVHLRVMNEPKKDQGKDIPFSSRHLVECFTMGADKFGWAKRDPKVGSMKRDGLVLGWGMAGCSWIAARFAAEASVELRDDGSALVLCGTQDIGTGTYTIFAQLVAEKVGIPLDKVEILLGDTKLPPGPTSGGSMTVASVIPAVMEACQKAIDMLLTTAATPAGSKEEKKKPGKFAFAKGRIYLQDGSPDSGMTFAQFLKQRNLSSVVGSGSSKGTFGGDKKPKFSVHSYGAHFVEVTWQPEIARLRASRVVTVIDAGRIINPLAGRNQIEGAVVMGVGMALFEETIYDRRNGAPMNSNLADYIVATHADCPEIDVHFLDYPDFKLNELGARGIGEIGLAGFAAATANAVYHATGVRVRELPIKIEDLLG